MMFGIYAGGLGADLDGRPTPGPAEDPGLIRERLDELGVKIVRGYLMYSDDRGGHTEAPPAPWQYAGGGRGLDLVACFRERGSDLSGWLRYTRRLVQIHGEHLWSLQVGEEANHDGPGGDGGAPAVRRAIVEGVLAAKDEADRLGLAVRIGVNSTPVLDPAQAFWSSLKEIGPVVDYAGLDCFPGVFRDVGPIGPAFAGVLRMFRDECLAAAGVPASTPIHMTEHGWPTFGGRTEEEQAGVVEEIVRIAAAAGVAAYEHFSLRDADSARDSLMYRFGLVRSDYSPKPAFHRYRELIADMQQPA